MQTYVLRRLEVDNCILLRPRMKLFSYAEFAKIFNNYRDELQQISVATQSGDAMEVHNFLYAFKQLWIIQIE